MNFLDLVSKAFFHAQDNLTRSNAEMEILALKDSNIDQFFILCA